VNTRVNPNFPNRSRRDVDAAVQARPGSYEECKVVIQLLSHLHELYKVNKVMIQLRPDSHELYKVNKVMIPLHPHSYEFYKVNNVMIQLRPDSYEQSNDSITFWSIRRVKGALCA